jgi:formylglycine-generating enzyme required for sulfatase activity
MDGTIDDFAWYRENSGGRTHPVAQKRCNPWGLYDMAGNVREYTFDTYMPGAENGGVPVDLKNLVPATIVQVRGGGFNSRRDQLRSSHFAWVSAKEYQPNPSIGLRLVYISEDDQENQACD